MSNDTRQSLIDALKAVLADSYALYLKTQNYHWNVTGINFKSLHDLFEQQYRELIEPIDEIAERIRSLGVAAPGSFSAFSALKSIDEAQNDVDAETMLRDLHRDQEKLIKTLNAALQQAQHVEDEASVDLLIGRIAVHEKNHWMLAATLG